MSNPAVDQIVDALTNYGLTSPGSDGRPWSRHRPATEFARVAVATIEDSYAPSDREVEAACEEFYDGTEGEDKWGFMILLDERACERARARMRRTLIRAHQSKAKLWMDRPAVRSTPPATH